MKYKVIYDQIAFNSDRTEYAPGENVEVRFIMVMTDVSTSFHLDVDEYTRTYENGCYVLRFVMPEHDVNISASMKSVMTYDPNVFGNGGMNTGFLGMGLINDMPAKGIPGSEWVCPACKSKNSGRFCTECGSPRPAAQ